MTGAEFNEHLGRLGREFGKVSQERADLIWREVKDFNPYWWAKLVDQFIFDGDKTWVSKLREEISKQRESLWRTQKQRHTQEAKDFFSTSYAPEDTRTICQAIIKRVKGELNDQDFNSLKELLNYSARYNPKFTQIIRCKKCEDSGQIFTSDNYVYRCTCSAGDRQPRSWPVYRKGSAQCIR